MVKPYHKTATTLIKGAKTLDGKYYSNEKIFNSFYNSYIKSKISLLPFVTCKLAISKDFFTINKKNLKKICSSLF